MSGIYILILGFFTAFVVVLFSMPSLIKVAKLKHLVDTPSEDRKLHRWSIPTLGGVVIYGAIIFSYTLWFPEGYDHINGALVFFQITYPLPGSYLDISYVVVRFCFFSGAVPGFPWASFFGPLGLSRGCACRRGSCLHLPRLAGRSCC